MSYLIDTNIISELRKGSRCDANVRVWWGTVRDEDLFLSVLVLGEIRKGIDRARPRDPAKADALERWLGEVTTAFADRVLPVDGEIADAWGQMSAHRTVPAIDALLAATAQVHGLALVTRDEGDVSDLGVEVVNPFHPT